jgi:hypothetical protein
VARSSAGRPTAGKPDPDESPVEPVEAPDPVEAVEAADLEIEDVEDEITRSKQTDAFWAKVKIDPVEIALPGGAGYTLRTYRMNTEVTPADYTARQDEEFPDRSSAYDVVDDEFEDDEFEDEELEDDELEDDELEDELDADDADDSDEDLEDDDEDDDDLDADEDDLDDVEDENVEEEVPLFLSQSGHLLLFRTRAGLVAFVQSDAEHDMIQLKGWSKFAGQLLPEHVVALPDDSYELDLVVKNLRSGHESWDPDLLVQSGQVARDIGHALRVESVLLAMAPGSPLDDLDEALRGVAAGGVGTFFARRKAKKIGSETAAISWRTVIGKISSVVDWRD